MMFAIDTGTQSFEPQPGGNWANGHIDRRAALMDAALDSLHENPTQSEIDARLAKMIIAEMHSPKTLKTVRRCLLNFWPLIAPMADREPELFDSILMEFAELTTVM